LADLNDKEHVHDRQNRFTPAFERFAGSKGGISFGDGTMYWRDPSMAPEKIKVDDGDHTERAIQAFLNSIRTGAPNVSTVQTARMATCTGLLVRKAVDEQRWVKMEEIM
jgi:myo-inositol 2-dehydrogenase / D-chiro-inositol 1-dehydrogenase